jgi:hypothetical protein
MKTFFSQKMKAKKLDFKSKCKLKKRLKEIRIIQKKKQYL